MFKKINRVIIHGCFPNFSGYASHTRNFATALNKLIPVRVRNFSYQKDLSHLTQIQKDMVIYQPNGDMVLGKPYDGDIMGDDHTLSIILLEHNHFWYYQDYHGPTIGFCVWESTRMSNQFFNRLLQLDGMFVPTNWQRQCLIDQGYPEEKVWVVPEGVDESVFKPGKNYVDKFRFLMFGRWDYRKATTENIRAFLNADLDAELILSSDNAFSTDEYNSTEERLEAYNLKDSRIKVIHFPPDNEYVKYLQDGHVFLGISRAEGWNLPAVESIASGIPVIMSKHGGQLDYSKDIAHFVNTKEERPVENVFNTSKEDMTQLGKWIEPDWDNAVEVIKDVYENYKKYKEYAVEYSKHIRETFTWVNAAKKAYDTIARIEIDCPRRSQGSQDGIIRLNLGCGNSILPGYINIDKSNGNADEDWDIINMPVEDSHVDEVLISHVLEHFTIPEVPTVLHQLNRILKVGGKLEIKVPDLEQAVKAWQNAGDKWQHLSYELLGAQDYFDNTHKCGFTMETLPRIVKAYGFRIDSCNVDGNQLILLGTKIKNDQIYAPTIKQHWVSGAYVHLDDCYGKYYQVNFLDGDGNHVHSCNMTDTWWTRTNRKYYTDWNVQISLGDELMYNYKMVLNRERVLISLDSKSLGDTLAWIPAILEFQKKHSCEVFCSTFWNQLFEKEYPELNFIEPGSAYENIYASYQIGCFDNDLNRNKNDWHLITLQQVAFDTLGLEYKEIIPKIFVNRKKPPIEHPYVCISEWSTARCKLWNFPDGWQIIVDYLNSIDLKVIVISKEPTQLKNIINRTNKSIEDTLSTMSHAKFMMTIGTGLAWVAWAIGIPIIKISGFSEDWYEFSNPYNITTPPGYCSGCFCDPNTQFDRGNWDWCPHNKNFECTTSITPKIVIDMINKVVKENF